MKKANIIISAILVSFLTQAQNLQHISVKDAVEIAVKNNNNVKISELDEKVANANYHQTDAVFLPQVTVGYTALSTNNPLNAFGFLLQQESVTAMDFDPAKLNNPRHLLLSGIGHLHIELCIDDIRNGHQNTE